MILCHSMPFRQSIIFNFFQNRAAPSRMGSLLMDRVHPFDTVFLKMINIQGKAIVLAGAGPQPPVSWGAATREATRIQR
jgi:hypothetical protein